MGLLLLLIRMFEFCNQGLDWCDYLLLDLIEMNLILYDNFNCCYIYIFKIEASQDKDDNSSVANSSTTTNCQMDITTTAASTTTTKFM